MSQTDSMEHICAIINPNSGKGQHNDLIQSLRDQIGDQVLLTTGNGDKKDIEGFVKKYTPSLCLVGGGDGTIKLVAETVHDTDIQLAILPLGSANGLAAEWNIGTNIKLLVEQYLKRSYRTQSLDALLVNGETCLHMADVGLNASMIKNFNEQPVRGFTGYALSAFQELTTTLFTEKQLQFEAYMENRRYTTTMFLIANCKRYGTGVIVNPNGNPGDGKFEIGPLSGFEMSHLGAYLFGPLDHEAEPFHLFHRTEAEIKLSRSVDFQVDGEYQGQTNHISIKLLPEFCQIAIPYPGNQS